MLNDHRCIHCNSIYRFSCCAPQHSTRFSGCRIIQRPMATEVKLLLQRSSTQGRPQPGGRVMWSSSNMETTCTYG